MPRSPSSKRNNHKYIIRENGYVYYDCSEVFYICLPESYYYDSMMAKKYGLRSPLCFLDKFYKHFTRMAKNETEGCYVSKETGLSYNTSDDLYYYERQVAQKMNEKFDRKKKLIKARFKNKRENGEYKKPKN